ncbi:MAG: SPOR domain-containing protein [Bacteroidetes bacterium]|nr:SPOR domain-containing protein [Bacteroidota bacterium]
MKNIESYISELLFEHDCVLIPAFGGFIARNASAHFTKTGNTLVPPSKSIVFNKNLTNNDGLLAGYVMEKEGLPYPQAVALIEQFVQHCTQHIEKYKRYEFSELGILYKSAENTLLFEQYTHQNHHIFSFGLPVVQATKRLIKEEKKTEEKTLQYRSLKAPVAKQTHQKPVRRIVAAASLAACIIALMFWVTHQNPIKKVEATLNPFVKTENKTTVPKDTNSTPSPTLSETKATLSVNKKPDIDTARADKTTVVKSVETLTTAWYQQPYQIVVGCFSVKQNAFKLINQLSNQNLQAQIAGQNAKNMYIVSVAGFTNEKEARAKLTEIKEQYPSAWLLRK